MTYEEFEKTCFHTEFFLVVPLYNIKIDKKLLKTKNKLDFNKIKIELEKIYKEKYLKI